MKNITSMSSATPHHREKQEATWLRMCDKRRTRKQLNLLFCCLRLLTAALTLAIIPRFIADSLFSFSLSLAHSSVPFRCLVRLATHIFISYKLPSSLLYLMLFLYQHDYHTMLSHYLEYVVTNKIKSKPENGVVCHYEN
jgi:hypothetical protein